jgi:hypothetical protein
MPIEIAPAMSSAMPPRMTSLDSPRDERPAVRANGTVRPSERPMTLIWAEACVKLAFGQRLRRARQARRVKTIERACVFPPLQRDTKGREYSHVTDNVRVYELTFVLSLQLLAADFTLPGMTVALCRKGGLHRRR